MNDFDWSHPYFPYMCHKDTRTKKLKVKDDIAMLLNTGNMKPLKGWLQIWLQLVIDIAGN